MGVTRDDIVREALKWNGWGNGYGYPGKRPNPMDVYLGRPYEFSCDDSIAYWYKICGLVLPSMQAGCSTGAAYCPDSLAYGRSHNAIVNSWEAQPGDQILINTGSGSQPGHTELVEKWENGVLWTIGGDSGPSNVDHYTGQGGVHRHTWSAPHGIGNSRIMAVIDMGKIVNFGSPAKHHKPAPINTGHRLLMLKSPQMHGRDVRKVQKALNKHGHHLKVDGVYGENTANAVGVFQKNHNLHVDRHVGYHTAEALSIKVWPRYKPVGHK